MIQIPETAIEQQAMLIPIPDTRRERYRRELILPCVIRSIGQVGLTPVETIQPQTIYYSDCPLCGKSTLSTSGVWGVWRCQGGCDLGGDVVDFIRHFEQLSEQQTAERMRELYNHRQTLQIS